MFLHHNITFSQNILMVDDDPAILDFVSKAVHKDYNLTTVSNAEEGLNILSKHGPFGLVISDLMMPGMNGIEFLSRVREVWPQTVRILFTGFADLQSATNAINAAHIFRLVTKPARKNEIIQAIKDGLRQHRMLVADEANLIEREQQFRTALMKLPLPAMIYAEDGEILLINQVWTELSGYDENDLTDVSSWVEKAFQIDHPTKKADIESIFNVKRSMSGKDFKIVTKYGHTGTWNISSAPLGKISDGRSVGIFTASDVTQRRAVEDSLSRAGQVFEHATNGIIVTDAEGTILEANPAICDISGFARDELIGENPRLFKSGRHGRDFYQNMWNSLIENGYWRGELWNRRKSGELYPSWLTISRAGGGVDNGADFVAITSDLSSLRQAQERMEYLSRYDPLTDLPNRITLHDRLAQATAYADKQDYQVLVGFLDLDGFKLVNESLGHEAGDTVLVEISNRFRLHMGEGDILVRWGGDNFVWASILSKSNEDAVRVARQLLSSLDAPIIIQGQPVFISACIGLSVYPDDAGNPETLIQQAETAMSEAKKLGRNQCKLFNSQMNQQVIERLTLESEMRIALEQNEFFLVYQPQVEIATGRIRGLEALVRWDNPRRGLLMPDTFLPIAEESGLIVSLGLKVLEAACNQIFIWGRQGVLVEKVAVNLSARQIWEEDLVNSIVDIIKINNIPFSQVEIEVTESVIMSSVEKAAKVLGSLNALGIEVSMDDFGTGYSSLYYLKKLPFHILKIDKSFVDDIPDDADSLNIVSSIATLAHGLGKRVVVEGVETLEQLEAVASLGCEIVQGFYFSRPLLPQKISELLATDDYPFFDMLTSPNK